MCRSHVNAKNNRIRKANKIGNGGSHTEQEWESLLKAYNNKCAYCGDKATERDHVLALSKGGTDFIDNIAPSCKSCNSSKFNYPIDEWLEKMKMNQNRITA